MPIIQHAASLERSPEALPILWKDIRELFIQNNLMIRHLRAPSNTIRSITIRIPLGQKNNASAPGDQQRVKGGAPGDRQRAKVKVLNRKGIANQTGPESCVAHREVRDEALTGEPAGQPLSRESTLKIRVPTQSL